LAFIIEPKDLKATATGYRFSVGQLRASMFTLANTAVANFGPTRRTFHFANTLKVL